MSPFPKPGKRKTIFTQKTVGNNISDGFISIFSSRVCASSGFGDFAVTIMYSLRAFQNGLETVKLAELRQCAIHNGMRIVGGRRFRRLSRVLGRPCTLT